MYGRVLFQEGTPTHNIYTFSGNDEARSNWKKNIFRKTHRKNVISLLHPRAVLTTSFDVVDVVLSQSKKGEIKIYTF